MSVRNRIWAAIILLVLLILVNTYSTHFLEGSTALVITSVTVVFAIVLGLFFAFYLARSIGVPIERIIYNLKQTQEGELNASIEVVGNDEFAQVSREINDFTAKLNHTLAGIDLQMHELLDHANHMTTTSLKSNVHAKSQQVGLGELLQLATKLTKSVHQVTKNAEEASSSANEADTLCNGGQQVITESVSSIRNMAGDISQSLNNINELQQDCQGITQVLDVISDIADQTNLLALNAAIEAARAGEQGRGFAVVADEVRTLAVRTQESTGEITKVINSLQARADAAVGYMIQVDEKSKQVVVESESASQALIQITEKVAAIKSMNQQIARVAEEQEKISKTIHDNVVKVNELSVNTVDQTRETQATGRETNELAKGVQSILAQFKLQQH